jgi:integral membrane protein
MTSKALTTFRIAGFTEAISFLLLLGVAMPLKHLADIPEPVKYIGWAHGVLWVMYLLAAIWAARAGRWSFWMFFWAGVASVLPFGPFVFDRWLKRIEATRQQSTL